MLAEILAAVSLILIILGLLGSFLPVLPGAPLAWVGLLVLKLSGYVEFSWLWVVVFGFLALAGIILDYALPAMGAKKFGGSKWGVWGTTIGLILGIIFPVFGPFTIFISPFIGALAGELLHNHRDFGRALKAAIGSFLGFLSTTAYGLLISSCMLVFSFYLIFQDLWRELFAGF